jgi:hypothetical protein
MRFDPVSLPADDFCGQHQHQKREEDAVIRENNLPDIRSDMIPGDIGQIEGEIDGKMQAHGVQYSTVLTLDQIVYCNQHEGAMEKTDHKALGDEPAEQIPRQ